MKKSLVLVRKDSKRFIFYYASENPMPKLTNNKNIVNITKHRLLTKTLKIIIFAFLVLIPITIETINPISITTNSPKQPVRYGSFTKRLIKKTAKVAMTNKA